MERALELQEEYVNKFGKVGETVSYSKIHKKVRYKLHKTAKELATVKPRQKIIILFNPPETNESIIRLINEFGYIIQTIIK